MAALVSPNPFILRPPADLLQKQPELKRQAADLANSYAAHRFASEESLQAIGGALWRAVGDEAALAEARQQAGRRLLPIVLESDVAAVQQLPWETLHHPTFGFLGRAKGFTLSRRIGPAAADPPLLEKGPLRVLLFTALPDDLHAEKSRLDVEEEQAQIQEALTPAISAGLVVLEMPDDGRFSTLQAMLQSFQPHLVFLSGHGKFYNEPHQKTPPFAVFQFEDDNGHSDFIDEKTIAEAFWGTQVNCVVLSACESGKGASADLASGLTWRLSQMGIPHVVGMREAVLDEAGTLFSRAVADAIARGERMDVALQAGRQAMAGTPLAGSSQASLGEQNLAQWCLPLLLSQDVALPLLDWAFTPRPPPWRENQQLLDTVVLPPRFIGRRSELRQIKSRLQQGKLGQLLLTGPGGQGKTALAGKIAQDLHRAGYPVFAYSARPENIWQTFFVQLIGQLTTYHREAFSRMEGRLATEGEKADYLLGLLGQQGRFVFFLDNLEAVQAPQTQALTDERLAAWITAAQRLAGRRLILLLTSRWRLPGWPEADHWPLAHASYGDFLQMAQRELPPRFLQDRKRLRQVYSTLHGNGRGLTLFAAAVREMDGAAEADFLAQLARAQRETQADMTLATIIAHLSPAALALLHRLRAYRVPVPQEGMVKLGLDLPPPIEELLQRLLAVSLVEAQAAPRWQVVEYQLSPLVAEWLHGQGVGPPERALRQSAARYLDYLYRQERRTLAQALAVHQALRAAEENETADRFALDNIVGWLNRDGLYVTLLKEWLPAICESNSQQIKGEALGQTGKQHHHLGNYATALAYLEQSLQISQAIGDKAGEGTTLNNISQIYNARGDYATALAYLEQSLQIRQAIGDKAGEGTTLNNISQIFKARGDYATALAYLEQSLQIWQAIGDKAGEGTTLNNMATTAHARGDYATALAYLEQSLQISQAIGDKAGEGTTLNNISQIYDARGDYATALAYLEQSLQISQAIGDKAGEGTTLNNISQIYDARGDYATALAYLEQSLQISQAIGDAAGLCATLFNMGHIHWQNGAQQAALNTWVAAYRLARQINLAQVLQALANLAEQLGAEKGLALWERLAQQMGEE